MSVESPQQLLKELLTLSPELRQRRLLATRDVEGALVQLSETAGRSGFQSVSAGLEATALVLSLSDEAEAIRPRVHARIARSLALSHSGRFSEAIEMAEEGRSIASAADLDLEVARCDLALMHPMTKVGRIDEAINRGLDARATFQSAGETALIGRADLNLGNVYKTRGDGDAALKHLTSAAEALRSDVVLRAQIENTRGNVLLLMDRFAEAEAAHELAWRLLIDESMPAAAAVVEGNLADLHARMGRLDSAIRHFEHARSQYSGSGTERHVARLLIEQGDAVEVLGLVEEALEAYEQAAVHLDKLSLTAERARALCGRGRCLLRLDRDSEARHLLEQARETYFSLGDQRAGAQVQLLLVELMLAEGSIEQAGPVLEQTLGSFASLSIDRAIAMSMLARVHQWAVSPAEAEAAATESVAIARMLRVPTILAECLGTRASIRLEADRLDDGISDLREAMMEVERVRGTFQAERFRTAFLGRRLAIYEDLVLAVLRRNDVESIAEAFAVAERAKSRALLDLVKGAIDTVESDGSATSSGSQLLQQLRRELNALYSQLDRNGQADQRRLSPVRWHEAIQAREVELERLESTLVESRGPATLLAPTIDASGVADLVGSSAAIVEYFVAGAELMAFVATADGLRIVRNLATTEALHEQVMRLQFQIRRVFRPGIGPANSTPRMVEQCRRELHELWSMILNPMEPLLAEMDQVTFVPHGPLHLVPFAALHDGHGYLVDRFRHSVAPSASVLAATKSRRSAESGGRLRAMVVGVADEFAPRIDVEAATVACQLRQARQDVTTLIGPEASVRHVLDSIQHVSLAHFACHGTFNPRFPRASGLRLADRWLMVREIYSLSLKAELITLSGCETGRSLVRKGDDLQGLTSAFLTAGAQSLLVTLWTVNDVAAATFNEHFYPAWISGVEGCRDAASALQHAQQTVRAAFPHPAYWAAFSLVGGLQ